jgi:hypothetical protein
MTNAMKVKHAIEVLKTLEARANTSGRYAASEEEIALRGNLTDLVTLLEKPHVTDTVEREKKADPAAAALAERLWNHIKARKSNARMPNMAVWTADMDKMLRLDGRTLLQMEEVIDWSQQHDFWQYNILSPSKLRKQLDRLEMIMSRDNQWKAKRSLRRSSGKSAKDKYLESLHETDTRIDA